MDDNVDAAVTVSALLRAGGHEVRTIFNGPAALQVAGSFRPDIVLLDIGLPGISGYEVARELRASGIGDDVILAAVTGYGQESDRERATEAGFNFHLTKPPDPAKL